jgi:hypothetical protein
MRSRRGRINEADETGESDEAGETDEAGELIREQSGSGALRRWDCFGRYAPSQ